MGISGFKKAFIGSGIFSLPAFFFCSPIFAATYYTAPSGHDLDVGSLDKPFATMAQAQSAAKPGDTLYFRGGDYLFASAADQVGVTLDKSGIPGKPIHYFAYPGEVPVFDFHGMTALKRIKGVLVTGSWLHVKGMEMKGVTQNLRDGVAHENWCVYVDGGNHDIFERLDLHHNMGPGLFIIAGGDNLILNCDSHHNYDLFSYANGVLKPGENADGFGFHSRNASNTGNVFRGCRAWWNADDGWDFIEAAASVTVENCWSWNNGYKAGTTEAAGNGNGFKVGGYGLPPDAPAIIPRHMIRFCLAFDNRAAGFYQNHHPLPNYYYDNTSFDNKGADFNLLGYDLEKAGDANLGILRNNLAFTGTALANASGAGVDAAGNSWNLPVTVTSADFISTDTAGVAGPRSGDGGLPYLGFMRLRAGSDLIDRGVDVQLPYAGSAPDLGAFESGKVTGLGARDGGKHAIKTGRASGEAHPVEYDVTGREARESLRKDAALTLPGPR